MPAHRIRCPVCNTSLLLPTGYELARHYQVTCSSCGAQFGPQTFGYRGYTIDPHERGWEFVHVGYDGPPDNRCGVCATVGDCKAEIDQQLDDARVTGVSANLRAAGTEALIAELKERGVVALVWTADDGPWLEWTDQAERARYTPEEVGAALADPSRHYRTGAC